jgi:large subunit ribosomal protein L21
VKKAIITTGGHQFIVSEGDVIEVELLQAEKTVEFEPLMIIDGEKSLVGAPFVKGAKVTADIVEQNVKADKVMAIRYKAKKRVHTVRGHRQQHTQLKIVKIA